MFAPSHPGGMPAISRGLSSDTPGNRRPQIRPQQGSQPDPDYNGEVSYEARLPNYLGEFL